MNVCILTVYNSENCGSFLQAYTLMQTIRSFGHNVYFFPRMVTGTSHSYKDCLKSCVKAAANMNPINCLFRLKQHFNFERAQQYFILLKRGHFVKDIDCGVIGSDTLWDAANKYFRNQHDVFCGSPFRGKKFFTYAVSTGNSTEDDFSTIKNPFFCLKDAFSISVRDTHSKEIIRIFAEREAELVCDPTLLVPKAGYAELERTVEFRNYLLLYYFGHIDSEIREEILAFSRRKKIKIISFGEYRSWCDVSISYDPFTLLSYYHHSDFVVTNTFHGNIFSIIYEKPYVSLANEKKKVLDLLEGFGLLYRNTSHAVNIKEILEQKPNPIKIKNMITEFRDSSMGYIRQCLKKVMPSTTGSG